jgi:tetratricopeptide (TPR) repeat protein
MKRSFIAIFCFLASLTQVWAQEKITASDVQNIYFSATQTLNRMPVLLNIITTKITEDGEMAADKAASFAIGDIHRIFYSKEAHISSDIDTLASRTHNDTIKMEDYLTNLDSQYPKTDDPSITFSNFKPSHVKKNGEFAYILIKFDSKFDQAPYKTQNREALLRVEKEEGKWKALIESIFFYDPAYPVDAPDNDLPVQRDTSSTSGLVTYQELDKQIDSIQVKRNAESKETDDRYNALKNEGLSYLADKHYDEAIDYLGQALDLKPLDIALDHRIHDIKRLKDRNTFGYLKNKGDQLKAERRYREANEYYKLAQEQKLDGNLTETVIKEIRNVLAEITLAKNDFDAKQYQEAIDECKKRIKTHKKELTNFPELYFIMGRAYEGLYLNSGATNSSKNGEPTDDNLKEALKNYNQAITYFPNYIDALITRGKFYVNYLNDYTRAISDYELVIQDATDDSPEKPGYYATEAKWKDVQGNPAEALGYYTKAIELNRKTDTLYFRRGELLYRQKRYEEAKANFDLATKYNPKYATAYFYRGLNFAMAGNNHSAGLDFTKVSTLGVKPNQKATIDSLSDNFFRNGEVFYDAHKYDSADSAYTNALEIYKFNANALHGIAKIYFSKAQELYKAGKLADAKKIFETSIHYNKEAIKCNPNFSDAYFKEGLAHYMKAEYDLAIKCYTDAVRTDPANVDAFIARADTYQLLKNYDNAGESYDLAIALLSATLETAKKGSDKTLVTSINNEISHINQLDGTSHYCHADYTNAMNYLNKALDINEENAEAFYYRGLVNVAINEGSKAIKDYNEALKISKDHRYYYAVGKAYYQDKDYQESVDNFTNEIASDTSGVEKDRFYLRGLSYFKVKAYDKAFDDYIKYDKPDAAKSDTAYTSFGFADLEVGKDSLASQHFKKALIINEKFPMALYGMGCYYAKAGNFDQAIKCFNDAFGTNLIKKEDIKLFEEDFLGKLKDNKPSKNLYNQARKLLANN